MNTIPSNPKKIFTLGKLIFKVFLLLMPFVPIIVTYFLYDPYMVLRKYRRFDRSEVLLCEGYVGWQNYLNNRDSIPYNSFIMGNSCTMAYRTDEWEKYLPEGSAAVRFFENSEGLVGVCQKLRALEQSDAHIDHVLVIYDSYSLSKTEPTRYTGKLFSAKAAGITPLQFQIRNFQTYMMPKRCLPFLEYKITGTYTTRMNRMIVPDGPIREPYTNNFINPREKEIQEKGEQYWVDRKGEFPFGDRAAGETDISKITSARHIELLEEIKAICDRNDADLTVVIGPDFFQYKLHPDDLKSLQDIFGESSVFDFTGVNEYTEDYHNYYESGHYRPCLGEELLKCIYDHRSNVTEE